MNSAQRVLVVDDDPDVRKSLDRLLRSGGFEVLTFGSASELLERGMPRAIDCVLADLQMPEIDGLELQRRLIDRNETPSIVFLSGHGDVRTSVRAILAGAVDFLEKPADDIVLLETVRRALSGAAERAREQAKLSETRRRLATLTKREEEVLGEVLQGKLNKQIAGSLGIVERTVKVHRSRLMIKMGAQSLAELVRMVEQVRADDATQRSGESPADGAEVPGAG